MSGSVTSNAGQIISELGKINGRAFRNVAIAVQTGGKWVETDWKANARQTAGAHGRWYPDAIKATKSGALESTVEPDESMRQGAMSFEYGSRRQPAHLDGTRAFAGRQSPIQRLIRRAVENAL